MNGGDGDDLANASGVADKFGVVGVEMESWNVELCAVCKLAIAEVGATLNGGSPQVDEFVELGFAEEHGLVENSVGEKERLVEFSFGEENGASPAGLGEVGVALPFGAAEVGVV